VCILQGMIPVNPPSELAHLNSMLERLEKDSNEEVRRLYAARGLMIEGIAGLIACMCS